MDAEKTAAFGAFNDTSKSSRGNVSPGMKLKKLVGKTQISEKDNSAEKADHIISFDSNYGTQQRSNPS